MIVSVRDQLLWQCVIFFINQYPEFEFRNATPRSNPSGYVREECSLIRGHSEQGLPR